MRNVLFFETLFPNAGSWADLREAYKNSKRTSAFNAESIDVVGQGARINTESCFTLVQAEHLNAMFQLLDSNEEAKATLAGLIEFVQMKSDVASF